MTTLRQQNSAIVLTSTAKSAGQAAGVTLAALQTQLSAFAKKHLTAAEREQRAAKEAEIEARAQALAERWTPFVSWFVVISFVVFVVSMLIWGQYLASQL